MISIHIQFILKGVGGYTPLPRIVYMCILVCVGVRIIRQKKKLLSFTEQRTVRPVHIELDVSNKSQHTMTVFIV